MTDIYYRVCNRVLDLETPRHCEWDGLATVADDGSWLCPSCGAKRWGA